MAGYTRNDIANNIATGNIINASDLDGEFDAIQGAFDATTGHVHDGTTGNGAPITKVGPTQDVVIGTSAVTPKTDNAVDLGSSSLEFKDLYIDGTAYIDALSADTVTISAGTITGITDLAIADGGTGASNASDARTNLGLAIGTNVQAYDPDLAAIAALTPTADNFIVGDGTTWTLETPSQARTSLGATTVGANLFTLSNPSAITFPRINADNTVSTLSASDFRTAIGAGTGDGTVTSVSATSPVASSGGATPTISLSSAYGDTLNPYASKTAKFVLAAPNAANGVPTFRALVASDIPTLNQNTTGTAANVTGTVAVANGGTGATSLASGNILIGSGTSAVEASTLLTKSAAVTSGTYIKGIGYADTVVSLGNTGTAVNLDVVNGGVFTATLTGSATITLRYPVASGASSFVLILTNDGTAGRTVAWSGGSFRFPGGASSLVRTTAANAVDIWAFFTPNGGTTWYGNIVMANLAA